MSAKLAALQGRLENIVATGRDMTEVVSSGSRLLPAGWAFARFVEYIELGNQPQEFQGKAKPAQPEVRLGFALYDTGDRKYSNDDGTPYIIRPYSLTLLQNDRAAGFKLFNKMNWANKHRHYGTMLGEGFLVLVVHVPKSKTDATIVSRLDLTNVLPPLDNVSSQPLPIPPARDEDIRYFFFDDPTIEDWNALHIDGTGKDGKSKNILQEQILAATNFVGSPLEALLVGNGVAFTLPAQAPAAPAAGPAAPALPGTVAAAPGNLPGAAAPVQVVPSVAAVPAMVPNVTASALPAVPQAAAGNVVAAPLEQPAATVVAAPLPQAATPMAPQSAPTAGTMTSPSEVAMPQLPSIPVAMPQLPALPQ